MRCLYLHSSHCVPHKLFLSVTRKWSSENMDSNCKYSTITLVLTLFCNILWSWSCRWLVCAYYFSLQTANLSCWKSSYRYGHKSVFTAPVDLSVINMGRYGAIARATVRQNNQFKVSVYLLDRYVGHIVSDQNRTGVYI